MDLGDTFERIVDALGERDDDAREQVVGVVAALGETAALELLDETRRIERDGGVLVADGSRRRTPGGVFLHLARRWLPAQERERIFHGAATAAIRGTPSAQRLDTRTAVALDAPSDPPAVVAAAVGVAPAAQAQRRRRIVYARGLAPEAPLVPANNGAPLQGSDPKPSRKRRRAAPTNAPSGARRAKTRAANLYPASSDGLTRRDHPTRTNEHAKHGANAREQARMADSELSKLASKLAADLLPMLREAMFAHIRGALLAGRPLGEPAFTCTSTSRGA